MYIIAIEDDLHWHELRRDHIGGSEISALAGDNPYTTMHAIWSVKRGLLTGQLDNPLMEHGRDMEPLVAKWLERTYGITVMKSNEYHIHPQYPWLGCTLDYYILEHEDGPALLEIKHCSAFAPGWSQVAAPLYIEMQVQHQLEVVNAARRAMGQTPFERIFIGSMHGGNPEDCRLMERRAMPDAVDIIIEKSEEFWQRCVVNGEEPPILSDKDMEHTRRIFLESDVLRESIDLTGDSDRLEADIAAFMAARDQAIAGARRQEAIKARLMRACMVIDGDDVASHTTGITNNYEIVLQKGTAHYIAREAQTVDTLRFDIRKRK